MVKVVTDLDGVLRDLNEYLHSEYGVPSPQQWKWKHEGKGIFQWIKEHPETLTQAPKTEYFDVIMDYFGNSEFEIWTNQPENWKALTQVWIKKHLKDKKYKVIYGTKEEKYSRLKEQPNTILIEDHPDFKEYSQIILIDTTYNQEAKAETRVKSSKQLKEVLNGL